MFSDFCRSTVVFWGVGGCAGITLIAVAIGLLLIRAMVNWLAGDNREGGEM